MNELMSDEGRKPLKKSDLSSQKSLAQLAWMPSPRRTVFLSDCHAGDDLLTSQNAMVTPSLS